MKILALLVAFVRGHFAPSPGTVAGHGNLVDLIRSVGTAIAALLALDGFTSIGQFVGYLGGFAAPYFAGGITPYQGFIFAAALLYDLLRRYAQHNPAPAMLVPLGSGTNPIAVEITAAP